jgi:hypothetical protein
MKAEGKPTNSMASYHPETTLSPQGFDPLDTAGSIGLHIHGSFRAIRIQFKDFTLRRRAHKVLVQTWLTLLTYLPIF